MEPLQWIPSSYTFWYRKLFKLRSYSSVNIFIWISSYELLCRIFGISLTRQEYNQYHVKEIRNDLHKIFKMVKKNFFTEIIMNSTCFMLHRYTRLIGLHSLCLQAPSTHVAVHARRAQVALNICSHIYVLAWKASIM